MKTKPKVLLIEDNQGDAELVREAFNGQEISSELMVIDSGEEAMLYLKQQENYEGFTLPHLILLDLNLPKIDGKEILQFIKNDADLKTIPVVVFTTSSLQNDITFSYTHHANCYVVKPGNLKDFFAAIKAIENFWLTCVTYPKK